jgi:hypothetical protein
MLALQFATATANLASRTAFLFKVPGDPRSNFHRLILLCHSNPVWVPVLSLELLPHSPQVGPQLDVKMIGTVTSHKLHTTLLA